MMLIFYEVDMMTKDLLLLKDAGINLSLLKSTVNLLTDKYVLVKSSGILSLKAYLYPFTVGEIPEEIFHGEDGVIELSQVSNIKEEEVVLLDIENYLPKGGGRYAEYKDGDTPQPITQSMRDTSDKLARSRRVYIRNAMKHAWDAYRKYAWGKDEVLPISNR